MSQVHNLTKSSKDQRLTVGHTIHHPIYGNGLLRASWGDVINVNFIELDQIVTIHDEENYFIVRKSKDSWLLLSESEASEYVDTYSIEYNIELKKIQDILCNDYINHEKQYADLNAQYVEVDEFKQIAFEFVKAWLKKLCLKHKKPLPDDEQILAIAAVNGDIQVVARAGSGKTTTLVYRTIFLLSHCRVDASEILILAFNKTAALEVRRRILAFNDLKAETAVSEEINRRYKDSGNNPRINKFDIEATAIDTVAANLKISLPFVMTFHALAYAIVHPEESILHNGAEGEQQGLNQAIQDVIDNYLQDPICHSKIRELMLDHFRGDWEKIERGHFDQSKDELLAYRRSIAHESIGGDYVKSFGEKLIADFLFEHNIDYGYERSYMWNGINYRPDFTIYKSHKSRIIIEYFGLKGDSDYDQMSEEKRTFWRSKTDFGFIEFSPTNITSNGIETFLNSLKRQLLDQGVICNRLSEEEIWLRVKKRAIDRFTKATSGFIGRCRKLLMSPNELIERCKSYSPATHSEQLFLVIVSQIYFAYLERLTATGEEDFDGLMQRAADAINSGETLFMRKSGSGDLASIRYLCIDEFQDFSKLFYRCLDAIRKINSKVEVFCVGDDWQAINGFAGSDLQYFNEFEKYIGESQKLNISTNYRSSQSIVDISNALMTNLGSPATAKKKSVGNVCVANINMFIPSIVEAQRHQDDLITPAVSRITNKALSAGNEVVMLSRRNGLPWFVDYKSHAIARGYGIDQFNDLVRSLFPKNINKQISISTAHKYKGLEKSVVIILDAVSRSYPLIHPDWVFSRILGESPEKIIQEERRLFYVALTRAVDTLIILTDSANKSPFLEELERKVCIPAINWSDYAPIQNHTQTSSLHVCVDGDTFKVKDLLKACSYKFNALEKNWTKVFLTASFTIDTIMNELWAEKSNGLDVKVILETEKIVAHYEINNGKWICIVDELSQINSIACDTEIDQACEADFDLYDNLD